MRKSRRNDEYLSSIKNPFPLSERVFDPSSLSFQDQPIYRCAGGRSHVDSLHGWDQIRRVEKLFGRDFLVLSDDPFVEAMMFWRPWCLALNRLIEFLWVVFFPGENRAMQWLRQPALLLGFSKRKSQSKTWRGHIVIGLSKARSCWRAFYLHRVIFLVSQWLRSCSIPLSFGQMLLPLHALLLASQTMGWWTLRPGTSCTQRALYSRWFFFYPDGLIPTIGRCTNDWWVFGKVWSFPANLCLLQVATGLHTLIL